jgi:hypothetical protein
MLLSDGHLLCPEEFADPKAMYKVIASIPDEGVADAEIESAAATDASQGDVLSATELDYYLHLKDPS